MVKTGMRIRLVTSVALVAVLLTACGGDSSSGRRSSKSDLNCMERAIFFEANRSSRTGMIAVGNVVMNRVASDDFPNTVCGVVGQKNQFAPGVMTRQMNSKALPDVQEAAVAVLRGERAPGVGNARFFHTYGYRFSYDNMHYVLTAGGNSFYEKRKSRLVTQRVPLRPVDGIGR
ncbi:cell wall hydrolase [Paracoccus tegillarcae]|uniref:Cell wall hydrolase n=1 Tax=Paracoccus tegillarcae TaxID=1529068 RepID=A0A2K9EXD3_9RHOB|nr:cell wall hydrolase [Paracoccus tegillarcae]AUH33964.1 cell wall hydrolase [Paracoccus tegillarcae]